MLRGLGSLKKAHGKGLIYKRCCHLHIEDYLDASYARDHYDRKCKFRNFAYLRGILVY